MPSLTYLGPRCQVTTSLSLHQMKKLSKAFFYPISALLILIQVLIVAVTMLNNSTRMRQINL
jgi:hypothetical protein